MAPTLADIERWSSASVREVFHVGNVRAGAAFDTANGLAQLPAFQTWGGDGAEAAKQSIGQVRVDLNAHGEEALAVARLASKAAGEIDDLERDVKNLLADAQNLNMQIDPASGTISPAPGSNMPPMEVELKTNTLRTELNKILAKAKTIDDELARAINMADGKQPLPAGPHDNRSEVQEALSNPVPQDPKQFNDLWNKLTPEEKDWLYSQDHNIGNHPGMPWDPDDHLGRNHYDRMRLTELQQQTQASIDGWQHRIDDLSKMVYMGDHSEATTSELNALGPQLLAARHSLEGYKAVQADLDRKDGVQRYLGYIDDKGHAAVAIGNPDKASRNAIFVPGTGQDLARFGFSDDKSLAMYNAARNADPHQTYAVTTWMGYDRPMDVPHAAWPDPARAAAGSLDGFEAGQRASHVGAPSIDTIVGHSYGTTMVGAAATDGHTLDANNVIAVGSPGMLAHSAQDLHLAPGANIYSMRANHDPIGFVTDLTLGSDPFNPDFGATRLYAAPGPSSDPLGLTPTIRAHSSYWLPGNPALDNMGAVIAGVKPPMVLDKDGFTGP